MGQKQWELSPLFDVNPAPERFRELKTAIADGAEPEASVTMLFALGKPFAQKVGKTLGEHVTVQVARRSELHTF